MLDRPYFVAQPCSPSTKLWKLDRPTRSQTHTVPKLSPEGRAQKAVDIRLKYGDRIPKFQHHDRRWPEKQLQKCPVLFSTDLRDGNQALRRPMTFEQKLRMWHLLISMGFKEIELGMPCANQAEFDFARHLVETPGLIPDDVLIQVITPCGKDAIQLAVDSVRGAKQAVILTYLPGSDNYRQTILKISEDEWVERARDMTAFARSITKDDPRNAHTRWVYNFGFEDYANARPEAIFRCSEAIKAAWDPTENSKMMFTLASSVESSMPNVWADQVERFCQNVSHRATYRVSVHTHNDRGGAVASAELASLAGADRVEGCLFGNGERAGNMDLVVYGLNSLTSGNDPGIDFSRLDEARRMCEDITQLPVHPRTPYSGDYYLKAFSGGHQNGIVKGLRRREAAEKATGNLQAWSVPYLPCDPSDYGGKLEDVIEISSQSGKTGVAWLIKQRLGQDLSPRDAEDTTRLVKEQFTLAGRTLTADEICAVYKTWRSLQRSERE